MMPSVVHVLEVHTTVCKCGFDDEGGARVEDIPPATTFTVDVCRELLWKFEEIVIGVVLFCEDPKVQIPNDMGWSSV